MRLSGKNIFQLFKTAATDWMDDHAPRLGAALAFYTIFSLAPLLAMIISIASLWSTENPSRQIFTELGSIIGHQNAESLQQMLAQPGKKESGIFTTVAAAVMLFFGATGVFVQLQDSLNSIWEVKAKPGQGIKGFIRNRLLSFAMVLAIAFLLLVSLLLTAAVAVIGKFFAGFIGDAEWLLHALNMLLSFGVITLLFALMFKYVPDAKIAWCDVWVGAVFTALLFTLGKFGLGLYLGKSSVASTYTVAGSLIALLLWVYYSSQIVFFGAELTQAYANQFGRKVQPSEHAEWDEEKTCQTEAAAKHREKKKETKGLRPIESPAFARGAVLANAVGAAPTAQKGHSYRPLKRSTRTIGGLILLLLVVIPIERKLAARA